MATITSPRASSPATTPRVKSPSVADTPTSSTRGSVELNVRPSASTSAQLPRRNRAALRDYYNLKSKPGQPGAGAGAGPAAGNLSRTASVTSVASETSSAPSTATLTENTSTPSVLTTQLDNVDFNAQGYVSQLLATSSLRDILKVEATLVSEIRNLDGERKALVYDNYSKLIKAVGTIGKMQRGMNDDAKGGLREVGALEPKMKALRASVRDIAKAHEGSARADAERRRKRKEIKELEKNKAIVRRVLNAPETLKRLMDEGKQEAAEKEWETVKLYLEEWHGVEGVAEVHSRCEELMSPVGGDEESNESDKSDG